MKKTIYTTCVKRIMGDLHTPVSIYLKVRDSFSESVLLESSDFHGNANSLSFIGLKPIATIGINSGIVTMKFPNGEQVNKELSIQLTVAEALTEFITAFDVSGEEKDACGVFGYTAFDCVKYLEPIPMAESHDKQNDAPDLLYILYKYIIRFNHFTNELTLIELLEEGEEGHLNELESIIENRNFASYGFSIEGEEESTCTDDAYRCMVKQGIAHCMRGDVFQIVISRRFFQRFRGDDFEVYRALRSINPSPYLFYFDFGGFRIFGSSPETHCKIEQGRITIDPIAGTFKRTGDAVKDRQLAAQLLADPKENAEHVMLVDLARNDLSRNAIHVQPEFLKEVHYYSHVIHLVSRISGDLLPRTSYMQAFLDTFPAGTLSGAPKVRAMQLISEIEPHSRGAYGGCIGFIRLNGELNQAIVIRTFVSRNNVLTYQAGAGIVSQSNAESELQEVNHKLGALKRAIDHAALVSHNK